jgi:hypothetical protein
MNEGTSLDALFLVESRLVCEEKLSWDFKNAQFEGTCRSERT